MNRLLVFFFALLLPFSAAAETGAEGDTVFLIKDYRYEAGSGSGDEVMGLSLCATRCNALSSDYLNFVEPGGWRMVKIAGDKEVILDLKNPYMDGRCICTVDEYAVKLDEYNRRKKN